MQLSDFVEVAPRFTRAINLERDAQQATAVDGYILTSTGADVLRRFSRSLSGEPTQRAWTLTGPYGSGKSAFALFLASLLGPQTGQGHEIARFILKSCESGIYGDFFDRRKKTCLIPEGFCPILLTGVAEPLLPALIRACWRDLSRYYDRGRPPAALKKIERLHKCIERNQSVAASDFITALLAVVHQLQDSGRSQGLLIIVDELGKFLEFAARDPQQGDIYLLQQLAEATAQCQTPSLLLVTILHQSFEQYASGLRPAVRNEWAKVQGRFEDVAFQEPPEQVISLVAHAITHNDDRHPLMRGMRVRAEKAAEQAFALGFAPRGIKKSEFTRLLVRCTPLHPTTTLALARLCRKFGQNQRSLFAFLVSREPFGFLAFLQEEIAKNTIPFFGLTRLYDYLAQAFGNGLLLGEGATRWGEAKSIFDRYPTLSNPEAEAVKIIGVLSAIGAYEGLKPSAAVIEFASCLPGEEVKEACKSLVARSAIVYRRHADAYALWQGSDIDLDERLLAAAGAIPVTSRFATRLNEQWTARPLVAKRHSFCTGTLRYFEIHFADTSNFAEALGHGRATDGVIVYCVPASEQEREELIERAKRSEVRERPDVLIAVPNSVDSLKDAFRELELIAWVENNTPELQGDAVARRELRARFRAAEDRVQAELHRLFVSERGSENDTTWYHCGIPKAVPSTWSLSQLLSSICDSVYKLTPRLQNELVNRRSLSSAAAAARRNLIDAMMTRSGEERLGIVGNPPEMSMYVSVLESTGLHGNDGTGYGFQRPAGDTALVAVWNAMEKFFATCELHRQPVSKLFEILEEPPFGLKMGVIPVIFCAAALVHDAEVALYENGAFVPELTVEIFERLLRSPETFDVRSYKIEGVRTEVFAKYASLLASVLNAEGLNGQDQRLVAIVRPLYHFFNRLPEYVKKTQNLTPRAVAVRECLLAAREPDILLFEELPRACGVEPFLPGAATSEEVGTFFNRLKGALSDLQRAYDDLLSSLQDLIHRSLGLVPGNPREMLRLRSQAVFEYAVEPRLRAFLFHVGDSELSEVAWIEAIATLLAGKPPRTWGDAERARYEVSLTEMVRNFRHMEALVFELSRRQQLGAVAEAFRIGVTDDHARELEAVVTVSSGNQSRVADGVAEIEQSLERMGMLDDPLLGLVTITKIARKLLSELDRSPHIANTRDAKGVSRE